MGQVIDGDVLPVDIAKVAQALEERLETVRLQRAGIERKEAQPRNTFGCLRARRERPRGGAAENGNELPPLHSITSSARAISVGGTSRPSALAVLRLITSSNLVGCTIGMSAGFSPLRMPPP